MTKKNNSKNHKSAVENKTPQTTGHSWDGIEEYNTPAPRWWLIVWLVTIIWSIIYWFFYPTWPTISGNSKGLKNWSSPSQLNSEQAEIDKKQKLFLEKLSTSNFEQIKKDPELLEFALNGGQAAFKENCAACHGTGAQGGKGFPNLNDDDWLWGGKIEDIYQTLQYGIRANHPKTRSSMMPAFGTDGILTKNEIKAVAEYVLSLSGDKTNSQANSQGQEIFKAQCAVCHGANAKGGREFGAPNLTDAIWLYGKNPEDIIYTITYSRYGVMPNWGERLSDNTIKQLALYIHSLGGGE